MYKKIILGTAQFDIKYGINHKTRKMSSSKIFRILNFLKKKNISFLDTARSYTSSEEEIGKYFQKTNKKFKIITKFSFKNDDSIEKQFKKSFNLLGYLPDTILAHGYRDYINPKFHEQIKNIKKKYLIKNVGVSLYSIQELTKILNYKKPDVIQVPINILDKRFLEKKIIKKLKNKSIKIIGRSIFLQGLFFKKKKFIFKNFKNIKKKYCKLIEIACYEKMTLGELSLCWAFHLKEINNIIIGVDSLSHLKNNLNSLNKRISKESYDQINKINLVNNSITKPYLWKIKQ
jgi:aryl-alcohol dehydrogenase-like predicted oxidoreductase